MDIKINFWLQDIIIRCAQKYACKKVADQYNLKEHNLYTFDESGPCQYSEEFNYQVKSYKDKNFSSIAEFTLKEVLNDYLSS